MIHKLTFYVEKVKYKTAYKIKFFSAQEVGNILTRQTLQLNEVLFESPVLILDEGTKNKVEVDLEQYNIDLSNKNVFVFIELLGYYDKNNILIQPNFKDATKLKFQLSKKLNYYAKMSDSYTKELTKELINMNQMINKDFAFMFFQKPHKSNLVAPAILLEATVKN